MLILKGDIMHTKFHIPFSNNGHVKMVSHSSSKLDLVVYQYFVRILSVKLWELTGVKLMTPPDAACLVLFNDQHTLCSMIHTMTATILK